MLSAVLTCLTHIIDSLDAQTQNNSTVDQNKTEPDTRSMSASEKEFLCKVLVMQCTSKFRVFCYYWALNLLECQTRRHWAAERAHESICDDRIHTIMCMNAQSLEKSVCYHLYVCIYIDL